MKASYLDGIQRRCGMLVLMVGRNDAALLVPRLDLRHHDLEPPCWRNADHYQDGQTIRPVHKANVSAAISVTAALSRASSETSKLRVSSSF